jgi:hypothetical protein
MNTQWIDLGNGNRILVEVDPDQSIPDTLDSPEMQVPGGEREMSSKAEDAASFLAQVTGVAKSICTIANNVNPSIIEFTAQVGFKGKIGIPVFLSTEGNTAFTLKLTWQSDNES